VIEEVHIRRQTASRPQEITGSVRRERIEVQTEGDLADDEAG
jgi:stress response protein YsnF